MILKGLLAVLLLVMLTVTATFDSIYAALFEFALARWYGNENMASGMTAVGLGGVVTLNFLAIVGVLVDMYGPLSTIPHFPSSVMSLIGVSPVAISYFTFVRRNRYVDVVRRFKERSESARRRAKIVAWTYVAASFVAPFLTLLGFPKR